MKDVLQFLNCNDGALMVIITVIYVIATIVISGANIKSANATREQLSESKRQFNETKRLECIPCFDFQAKKRNTGPSQSVDLTENLGGCCVMCGYTLFIDNVGKGIAKDIRCVMTSISLSQNEIVTIPLLPLQKRHTLYPMFCADKKGFQNDILEAKLSLYFSDLLGNHYMQAVDFQFSYIQNAMEMEIKTIHMPVLQESQEAQND